MQQQIEQIKQTCLNSNPKTGEIIRLADVMYAYTCIDKYVSNENYKDTIYQIWINWKGLEDDLTQQSPETIELISNLIK